MQKQIFRSVRNKKVAGVCGGIGEYFSIDPTVVRIAYVALSLMISPLLPAAILAYFAAAIIIPQAPGEPSGSYQGGFNTTEGFGFGTKENTEFHAEESTGFSDAQSSDYKDIHGDWPKQPAPDSGKGRYVIGIVFVALGGLLLLQQLFHQLFDWKYILPLVLILFGGFIVFRGRRN